MRSPVLFVLSSFAAIFASMSAISCMAQQPALLVMTSFGDTFLQLEPLVRAAVPPPSPEDQASAGRMRGQAIQLRGQGQFDEAIAALQQSVTLDPTHLDGYVILGWTQHLTAQREEAEAALLNALAIDADYIPALNALGIVYLVDGQLDNAVQTHTHALTLNPSNEIAAYNLSLAYQRLQRYDDAIDYAVLATELEPQNPHPWVALAIAHESDGNASEAKTAYRQAWSLDSRYGDRVHLAHLEQAGFSPDQIRLTEVIWSNR